jgi:AcrR family transcriptional regulator
LSVHEGSDNQLARRCAILDAALQVFLRFGFKKTSMDDLARAAGLSRQGLYLHFATKEALFKEAVLRTVSTMRAAGRAALAREDSDVEERLLSMFQAVHGELIGQPGSEHMNELLARASELVGPVVDELEQGVVTEVARVLRQEGIAADWKRLGITAKDLAEQLSLVSQGLKHTISTQNDYADRMRIAVQMVCRARADRSHRG